MKYSVIVVFGILVTALVTYSYFQFRQTAKPNIGEIQSAKHNIGEIQSAKPNIGEIQSAKPNIGEIQSFYEL